MPAIQTTYNSQLVEAFEGMVANTEEASYISREVEGAAIGFGKAVKQGASDYGVLAATAAADKFRGITVRENSTDGRVSVDNHPLGSTARIMTEGVIWVKAGATVVAGDAAYMIVGSGLFTNVSTSNLPIPRAIFDTSGVNGDLVKLRLA